MTNEQIDAILAEVDLELKGIYKIAFNDLAYLWEEIPEFVRLERLLKELIQLFSSRNRELIDLGRSEEIRFRELVIDLIKSKHALLQEDEHSQIREIEEKGIREWFNKFWSEITELRRIIESHEQAPLKGQYTNEGLAIDATAYIECLDRYQYVINRFYNQVELFNKKKQGIRANVIGLKGSLYDNRERVGLYKNINFETVQEMHTIGKLGASIRGEHKGEFWSGTLADMRKYPSDIDIVTEIQVDNKTYTTETSFSEAYENAVTAINNITRRLFNDTGVYIQPPPPDDRRWGMIPIRKLLGTGLIDAKKNKYLERAHTN